MTFRDEERNAKEGHPIDWRRLLNSGPYIVLGAVFTGFGLFRLLGGGSTFRGLSFIFGGAVCFVAFFLALCAKSGNKS